MRPLAVRVGMRRRAFMPSPKDARAAGVFVWARRTSALWKTEGQRRLTVPGPMPVIPRDI
jgi:hypothetical protein